MSNIFQEQDLRRSRNCSTAFGRCQATTSLLYFRRETDGQVSATCFLVLSSKKCSKLKNSIAPKPADHNFDPLAFDRRHNGDVLSDLSPVIDDEVRRLLVSMLGRTSSMDLIPISIHAAMFSRQL